MEVDNIVVGQGLAGSAVALQLLKRKKKIIVFDDPAENSSSRIAAGLFNPVTGKKMAKTWLASAIFPYLHTFYRQAEKESGEQFFHPMPLYRPFVSIAEQNEWMARSGDPSYAPFIEEIFTSGYLEGVRDPYGGLLLKQCGFLNTRKYIHAAGILIQRQATLCREVFCPEDLVIEEQRVSYRGVRALNVIFCTGVNAGKFFNWIPLKPLKGETLSIRTEMNGGNVINRGVYMVPEEQPGSWRVGATYQFHDSSPATTAEGRKELEEKISELITIPFEVTDHQWGFRPTTPDRRPILGAHPQYRNLILFNGLGTKGVSLAPYFSEVLVRWMEKEGSINKEVDIDRFKSVYSASA
jgi:glycine/D-amino acid oxidase-like deaminating enzyme